MAEATLCGTLNGHKDRVNSIAFSPDSTLLASVSGDKTVRLWSIPDGNFNAELKGHDNGVLSVSFSPDGRSIVTGSIDCTVRTWSVTTKLQLKTLSEHSSYVWSVNWSPINGDLIASGSEDTTVILWDATFGSVKRKLKGHTSYVYFVSFSQNGNKLASAGSEDKTMIVWDVNSGAALLKLGHPKAVWCACFSKDDQFVATACSDKIIRLLNVSTGRLEKRFEGHTNAVLSVNFSYDGSLIVSGSSDHSVRLWDVASTKRPQQLNDHNEQVNSVAFSPDGKYIASGSEDKTIRLWNAPSQKAAELEKQKQEEQYQLKKNELDKLRIQQQNEKKRQEISRQQAELEKKKQEEIAKQAKEAKKQEEEIERQRQETERQKAKLEQEEIAKRAEEAKKQEQIKANLDPTQVSKWMVDDVCNYLKQAGIDDDVVQIFRNENIKGKALAKHATEDMLKKIGIKRSGDQVEVIDAINNLFSSSTSSSSSSSTSRTGFKVYEIDRRDLTKIEKLNEGNFGIVWRGTYTGIPVAIKEPKLYGAELNPKKQLADLIEEATVMTSISVHLNVLHCYGISRVGEDDYWLVTELCNLGSLDAFLKKNPKTSAVDRRRFSQQVARGLNHLGKHNIAHRDVAARNVLLHDQGSGVIVAKVCDFGLSRQREGEYYVITGQHLLSPETAPEVFKTGKHSTRSDVWSFGVLLWEVESLCATHTRPDTQAFPPLPKPAQASDNMYEIMLKCWAKDPHQRPSFEALVDLLAEETYSQFSLNM